MCECVSVCVSVTHVLCLCAIGRPTGDTPTASVRYGKHSKMAFSLKTLCSKVVMVLFAYCSRVHCPYLVVPTTEAV